MVAEQLRVLDVSFHFRSCCGRMRVRIKESPENAVRDKPRVGIRIDGGPLDGDGRTTGLGGGNGPADGGAEGGAGQEGGGVGGGHARLQGCNFAALQPCNPARSPEQGCKSRLHLDTP